MKLLIFNKKGKIETKMRIFGYIFLPLIELLDNKTIKRKYRIFSENIKDIEEFHLPLINEKNRVEEFLLEQQKSKRALEEANQDPKKKGVPVKETKKGDKKTTKKGGKEEIEVKKKEVENLDWEVFGREGILLKNEKIIFPKEELLAVKLEIIK